MKLTKTLFAISAISIFAVACKSTGFNFGGETTNLTDIKKVCVVPHMLLLFKSGINLLTRFGKTNPINFDKI